jgi:hypothetical protein
MPSVESMLPLPNPYRWSVQNQKEGYIFQGIVVPGSKSGVV